MLSVQWWTKLTLSLEKNGTWTSQNQMAQGKNLQTINTMTEVVGERTGDVIYTEGIC